MAMGGCSLRERNAGFSLRSEWKAKKARAETRQRQQQQQQQKQKQ
jgi:hypothetical protein